jgi:magnesium transporter
MITAVEFDFPAQRERTIPAEAAVAACARGLFCWIDVDVAADRGAAEAMLRDLGIDPLLIARALEPDGDGRHDVYDDCLHLGVIAGSFRDGRFATAPVDLVLGARFLVTIRRGAVEFLDQVRRTYRQDFLKFARSPGFLLFECWDHLIDGYKTADRSFEDRVGLVQEEIFGEEVDDAIFARVAAVTRDLLAFRRIVLSAREVLHELCTRRSAFVPATTVPALEQMVGMLDRLGSDLAVEREILAETLNLYMGLVSHRTNKVLNRLTVVSLVFLPLTFLCGVYGMNFEVIPELKWRLGYPFFWALALMVATATLAYMKRRGWW